MSPESLFADIDVIALNKENDWPLFMNHHESELFVVATTTLVRRALSALKSPNTIGPQRISVDQTHNPMNPKNLQSLVPLAILAGTMIAPAQTQVGDFRLDAEAFAGGLYYFEPGFENLSTRDVAGSPFQLTSLFSGTSQKISGAGPGDPATDPGIQTSPNETVIRQLNRYVLSDPLPAAGEGRLGTLQYEIDLTPVADYLTESGDALTDLNLELNFILSDQEKPYDVYLSYTDVAEGMTETPISGDDPDANYDTFFLPSQGGTPGDVINGTHKIVNLGQVGNLFQTTDLLAVYNAGVRKVKVIVAMPAFFLNRNFAVQIDSGVFVATDNLSMEQVGDLLLSEDAYPGFYYADQFSALETRPVPGATFDVPSILSVTAQTQGNNPRPAKVAGLLSLDGVGSGTNTFIDHNATVTGFGVNGIGASSSDQYQFTAWKDSGDMTVDVKLSSLTSVEPGARAGLMIRGSRDAGAAHAFVGIQQSGESVVVTRDAGGNLATETLGAPLTLPQWLRITRVGDDFSFFISADGETYSPASPDSATIVMADPVYVGMAATSGSAENNAVAVFEELSETLAVSHVSPGTLATDMALQTDRPDGSMRIHTLNRYLSTDDAGVVQWSIDLNLLENYLTSNSLTLESLSLKLLADPSDGNKKFGIYLSYTDPSVPITLIGISPFYPSINYQRLYAPADGFSAGDIVEDTHKVLVANTVVDDPPDGIFDLSEDLLDLYNQGVRELNLMIASTEFYSNRNLDILEGSGLFIETSGGPSTVVITDVSRVGNTLSLTVDGLTAGNSYHLGGSADLSSFPSIPGTTLISATGVGDVFTVTNGDPKFFVRVLEGAAP